MENSKDAETNKSSEEEIIKIRKEKILNFFKKNYNWAVYIVLAIIVYLTFKIRTGNLSKLKDVTTGTWTLGPDLDPWLFLRWAKYIVENGSLMQIDYMRYVPLGFETVYERILHVYLIAWFHKFLSSFGWTDSFTYSTIIYPAVIFSLTVIILFLTTRKIFVDYLGKTYASVAGLVSAFFFSVIPVLLPRTVAGIPEKEASFFFFMFLAFYLFIGSWKAKKELIGYGLAILSGIVTGCAAYIWGGYTFIFLTIATAAFIEFLFGKVDYKKSYIYALWIFFSFSIMIVFPAFTLKGLIGSIATGLSFLIFFVIMTHNLIFGTKIKKYFENEKLKKIPKQIISLFVGAIVILAIASFVFGPNFIIEKAQEVKNSLIKPSTSRISLTVAENKQPYFVEWVFSFGPSFEGIYLTFWLFFVGSVYLFYNSVFGFEKKERLNLTLAYLLFLLSLIFSRYSSSSVFNGENLASKSFLIIGFLSFVATSGYYYYKYYRNEKKEAFDRIDFGILLLLIFSLIGIISARGAIRLTMILALPASIIISYFVVDVAKNNLKFNNKEKTKRFFGIVIVLIVGLATVYSGYTFYKAIKISAENYAPSIYNQQWQKAMAWVRENTDKNAVFAHWWDYGYWVQSIGERATVLDGGNAIGYWNHFMGRHALTGTDNYKALEFLYAHNVTHFLIDSTDIGKYGAFSSIGSDVNYDRASYIPTFVRNAKDVQERKNSTLFLYRGYFGLDHDIIYELNGTKIFLPKGRAFLGGVLVETNSLNELVGAPVGIYVLNEKQYRLPLRYAYRKNKFYDFKEGIESGIFIYPMLINDNGKMQIDFEGALLYLNNRTVKSQIVRLYLYGEENEYFKLAHSEDDYLVAQIKAQNPSFNSDFIEFGDFRGPIKIWKVDYPKNITLNKEFLETKAPKELNL